MSNDSYELDLILLEQTHSCKSRLKRVRKLIRELPDEEELYQVQALIENRIVFLERYIKSRPRKRVSIRRTFGEIVYRVKFMYFKVLISKSKKNKNEHT